jgi:CRISPR-associated protein Cmr4
MANSEATPASASQQQDSKPFLTVRYCALTLDPVHIGTGGYRLGRVDNSIVREPGTNLPKMPGSSISGPARAYTAMAIDAKATKGADKKKFPDCAGKGKNDGESHCGKEDCPVCIAFGFSKKALSFQGLAQFFDARILFFPVHSMIGPVWVTSPETLKEFDASLLNDKLGPNGDKLQTDIPNADKNLNLGWLFLEKISNESPIRSDKKGSISYVNNQIINRLVLIPDKLFSRIVNDNLEVRTSVSIDPFTGAAEHGALFTYEAIPRATVLWFDVVFNKPEYFKIGEEPISLVEEEIRGAIQDGFTYFNSLGVGGMNTRGMGRLKITEKGEVK